jgi:DHA2 family multidrug resistance protein
MMSARLQGQAAVMSFIDIFAMITVLFGGLALAALLMRPAEKGAGGGGH